MTSTTRIRTAFPTALSSLFALGLALVPCLALVTAGCGGEESVTPSVTESTAQGTNQSASLLAGYDRGLDYLAAGQEGGIWSVQGRPNPGYTAMAATAFLERPGGMRETDREIVDGAVRFVAGSLGDDGGVEQAYRPNYETSAAIMVLAAAGGDEYAGKIAKAAAYIKTFQFLDESHMDYGGIGYGSDNTRSDLSNTQYALASLRAAGISADDPVFRRSIQFLARTQNLKENETPGEPTEWKDPESGRRVVRANDGGANYRPFSSKAGADLRPDGVQVSRSYGSMTYALLRCYHLAGLDVDDPRVAAAVEWVSRNFELDANPGLPEDQAGQGLFYYFMTMGKALGLAKVTTLATPDGPVEWRDALSRKMLSIQKADGSWVNAATRWNEGDPVLATAYALSALASCAAE